MKRKRPRRLPLTRLCATALVVWLLMPSGRAAIGLTTMFRQQPCFFLISKSM